MLSGSTQVLIKFVSIHADNRWGAFLLTGVDVTSAILLHGVGKLGGEEDVLTLAGVLLEPLTEKILAVLIHVRSVPEEIALVVDLVEDREALRIGFRLAVEGTLVVKNTISTCRRKKSGRLASEESTHQAHGTIANPVDMRSILAEFGGWQLALAGDFADGFFDFVHDDCREGEYWLE